MTGPVRVGTRAGAIWDEPDDRLVARKLFGKKNDQGAEFDLTFSVYDLDPTLRIQAAAEHHAQSGSPDPPSMTIDYLLDSLVSTTPAPRTFAFQLISRTHAVVGLTEAQLLALVGQLRASPERRIGRKKDQVLAFIADRLHHQDPEWVAYLSRSDDRAKDWSDAVRRFDARRGSAQP